MTDDERKRCEAIRERYAFVWNGWPGRARSKDTKDAVFLLDLVERLERENAELKAVIEQAKYALVNVCREEPSSGYYRNALDKLAKFYEPFE